MAPASSVQAAPSAWDAVMRGELEPAARCLSALHAERGEAAAAWRLALEAACWFAVPERFALPDRRQVERFGGCDASARTAAALVCVQAVRDRALAFDGEELDRWHALHETLSPQGDERMQHWLAVTRRWSWIARGRHRESAPPGEAARATRLGDAPLAIELVTQQALASLLHGDAAGARSDARRASRMARTEALPQSEYLANLVLARIRRTTGRVHLATRILTALAQVAPGPWHGWLGWELVLSGGADAVEALASGDAGRGSPAGQATAALRAMLDAAAQGARGRYDAAVAAVRASVQRFAPAAGELERLVCALDPEALEPAAGELRPWWRGAAETPGWLHGVAGGSMGALPATPSAWVLARPGAAPRRIVGIGVPLAEDAIRVQPTQGSPGRVESTIAALAVGGARGLPAAELFRTVYGFPYEPGLHRGVFDVLLHRVRSAVADCAELVREEADVRLVPRHAFAVPDPRSAQPLEEQMLRFLASNRAASAADAARALKVPLRTVQRALHELVDEGACERVKEGRRVVYRVEDTTFEEPTALRSRTRRSSARER